DVYDEKTVVEKGPEPEPEEGAVAEGAVKGEAKAEPTAVADAVVAEEDEEPKFNPKTDITLEDAQKINKKYKIGDVIRTKLEVPAEFGRMAAQTAKQVIIQKLREAERETLYKEYQNKIGHIVTGMVQRVEGKVVLIDLGHAIAVMPPQEQIRGEMYMPSQRVKIFLVSVDKTNKGPEIIASRAHPDMVKELFMNEVPEIGSGAIDIKSIAREAGSRTKIAVVSNQDNIDPIGSCVGQRGTRVQTIINELGGEKIDIVEWADDAVRFIMNALSPAKVLSVKLDEEKKTAMAEVKEDQLSLAIGKGGQNVRLAAQLTGYRIDVVKEGEDGRSAAKPKVETPETPEAPAEETPTDEAPETPEAPAATPTTPSEK
ncbi:MAG: transcription termination factor NusA, partial [Candidatus Kerfeldbacteria bacterium RIFCSPHIGHO2_12_FULL_48_17]